MPDPHIGAINGVELFHSLNLINPVAKFSLIGATCFIFSNDNHHRSCLIESNQFRARPNLDTYVASPSNHFYIHYDVTGYNAPILSESTLATITLDDASTL